MRESLHEQGKIRYDMEDRYTIPHKPVDGCPGCYANGKLEVIACYPPDVRPEAATALLVLAKNSPNGDDYLVFPGNHAVTEDDLPADFTAACNYLRKLIPWMKEAAAHPRDPDAAGYHDGTNYGASAGQTLVHVHRWYSLVPEGFRVPGIATQTRNELLCQDELGRTLEDLVRMAIAANEDCINQSAHATA